MGRERERLRPRRGVGEIDLGPGEVAGDAVALVALLQLGCREPVGHRGDSPDGPRDRPRARGVARQALQQLRSTQVWHQADHPERGSEGRPGRVRDHRRDVARPGLDGASTSELARDLPYTGLQFGVGDRRDEEFGGLGEEPGHVDAGETVVERARGRPAADRDHQDELALLAVAQFDGALGRDRELAVGVTGMVDEDVDVREPGREPVAQYLDQFACVAAADAVDAHAVPRVVACQRVGDLFRDLSEHERRQ
ncbi:hypothetical protein ACFFOU_09905 [Pseudonocardia sulfidoxydans]|uniref:hypothetical protein n=1 Tax=Pseudonocardia sulfidoxydans TaxID=54011 RepID=UPI0011BDE542|nr:hypothetical protein [Pseudonocardia sulfidoxydans]